MRKRQEMTKRELRIVNPNTDVTVTGWLAEAARRIVGETFAVVAVNADSGLPTIQTPEDAAAAAGAVISAISAQPRPSGAIIAAFGDPGLGEARALGWIPVVGLGTSGLLAAASGGRRFSIVTLGAAMRAMILARAARLGLSGQLAGVRFLPFSNAEMIADRPSRRPAIAAAVRACADEDGAETVLLGGAPFAGLAASLSQETGVVVLDGVEASVVALMNAMGIAVR
jgi:allantoin racemase